MSGPFVGRQDALQMLAAAIDDASAGHSSLVLVDGEPGIGKTRLVTTATDAAAVPVLWATCWQGDGAPAFWPWQQLVRALPSDPSTIAPLRDLLAAPADRSNGGEPVGDARFALFDAVADALEAASSRDALVLVLDDLHWADASSIRLLQFLARDRRSRHLAMLATYRDGARHHNVTLQSAVGELGGDARHVHLTGLDESEVELLARAVAGDRATLPPAALLHRRSGGNPLFVSELARVLDNRPAGGSDDVPTGVRAVIGRRLDEVSAATAEVLATAAVIGVEFDLTILGAVTSGPETDVAPALDEALAVHLVRPTDRPATFAFVHALVQEVLYDRLGLGTRAELHRRVAGVLEVRGVRVSEVAHHLLLAAQGADQAHAVEWAVRAAEQSARALAYEQAADWYGRALQLALTTEREGDLLIRRGDAAVAAGDLPVAREAFRQAAVVARQRGDTEQLARAALGLGAGRGGFEVPQHDAAQVALLEEAAVALGPEPSVWRAFVLARTAVALTAGRNDQRRQRLSDEAIAVARAVGDPAALGYALAVSADVLSGPDWSTQRRELSTEVIDLARRIADRELELLGRRLRVVASFELGDMAAVDQDVAEFAAVADQLGQPQHRWYVPLWLGTRALMRGDVTETARLEAAAAELGRRAHSDNAVALVSTQRWVRHRAEGRFADAGAELAEILGFEPGATPLVHGPPELRLRAVVAAPAGDDDTTADLLAHWAATALQGRPLDSEWLPETVQVAEVAALVGNQPVADALFEQLEPYADCFCVEGIGAAFTGSVRWYLSLLARTLDRHAAADSLGEAARAAHRRVGLVGDPPALAAAPAALVAGVRPTTVGAMPATMAHEGTTWALTFDGRTRRVADAKGVRDLAALLARPDEEVHCLELAGGADVGGDAGPVLDQRARRAYEQRIRDLQVVIQDGRDANDLARAERAEDELDALVAQLAGAFGLGGRNRATGAAAERARSTVTSRLRAAIRRVAEVHPALGRHLQNAVHTGTWCAYRPDRRVTWDVDDGQRGDRERPTM